LAGVHGPPLGVRAEYETNRHRLDEGDTLILFTDGVVERRGEDVSVGVDRLSDVVASAADAGAIALADRIVEQLCDHPDDDCCLLIIRRVTGA
jgi:serine phosphatase RsbU (regulator of sigma subunit)